MEKSKTVRRPTRATASTESKKQGVRLSSQLGRELVLLSALLFSGAASAAPSTDSSFVSKPSRALPENLADELTVAPGFVLEVFARGVENARQMALAEDGTLLVGSRHAGNLYALPDKNGDFYADSVITLASNLRRPSGIAYRAGNLYVADINVVLRFSDVLQHLQADAPREVIYDKLPSDGNHGWKYLRFAPNGELTIPVGAPCDICDAGLPYAAIHRLNLETNKLTLLAQGVRNSVGFDYHPVSGELWFTDNGRDMLGNEIPGDELNRVTQAGQHFGYPYIHAGDVPDPEFGKGKAAKDYRVPEYVIPAHHAPLGMTFIRGESWPKKYRNSVVVAEHGSWNRDPAAGYRVMVILLDETGKAVGYEPLVEGWLQEGWLGAEISGRPADVLQMPDGSLLISDDKDGMIYRLRYVGEGNL
jgi:glucose/arabinose dehydrogenase